MIRVDVVMRGDIKRIAARLPEAYLAAGQVVIDRISPYPGTVRRPIRWASERQRRYVLARVSPLPYRRQVHPLSQRLATSWRVRARRGGADVVSRATYAQFVVGEKQQPMHAATGWPKAKDVVREVKPKIKKIVKRMLR